MLSLRRLVVAASQGFLGYRKNVGFWQHGWSQATDVICLGCGLRQTFVH